MPITPELPLADREHGLQRLYTLRAVVSIAWVALALTVGRSAPALAAVLLVAYPAWDALANLVDARRSGGLGRSPTQALNVLVSGATTVAVLVALPAGAPRVFEVFGAWAILAGVLQFLTAARRWKRAGAQWAMLLSGAQSALAGGLFIAQAGVDGPPPVVRIAGYAGVGALYFAISASWLAVARRRRGRAGASTTTPA